ncbi:MAG TPA: glycosyltransferase family 2 protein [Patescibacteria group bacterium]|nr:glycosyltransferase family 2 protein [Patescibacteria group bacterium]
MSNKKYKVSIGIPAYNEEANIKKLLLSLLSQKEDNFKLYEIIIISDGSTDRTVDEVRSVKSRKINLIVSHKRRGQGNAQNSIIKSFRGDVLVMLNADVLPKNKDFISRLLKPFSDENVVLVGPKLTPIKGRTFTENVLNYSVQFKDLIAESWKSGNNLFLCRGGGRAFSRDFAKTIHWKDSLSEDAYSYLLCKNKGYKFHYQKSAEILFKSPDNFADHMKQSGRFVYGPKIMSKYFDESFVMEEYSIPSFHIIKFALEFFVKNPVYFSSYVLISLAVRLNPFNRVFAKNTWHTAHSSKNLNISS